MSIRLALPWLCTHVFMMCGGGVETPGIVRPSWNAIDFLTLLPRPRPPPPAPSQQDYGSAGIVQRYATPSQWKAKEVRLSFFKGEGMTRLYLRAGGGSTWGVCAVQMGRRGAPKPSFYKRRRARIPASPPSHAHAHTPRAPARTERITRGPDQPLRGNNGAHYDRLVFDPTSLRTALTHGLPSPHTPPP